MTAGTGFEPAEVNVRVKISALWTAILFVFVYVDIFSLYRPDVRASIEAGEIGGFAIDRSFLLATTIYVVIPSLMVFGALVLRPRIGRIANIGLGVVYALTIVAGAIGEWSYYLLGSALEIAALAGVIYYAWTWPRLGSSDRVSSDFVEGHDVVEVHEPPRAREELGDRPHVDR